MRGTRLQWRRDALQRIRVSLPSLQRSCLRLVALALVLLTACASLLGRPEVCHACSCANVTVQQAFEQSSAVFVGKVLDQAEVFDPHEDSGVIGRRYAVRFEVQAYWKGDVPSQAIVYDSFTSCGIGFTEGSSYLVYAYERQPGEWTTHLCSRTKELAGAEEDLQELGEGRTPTRQIELADQLQTTWMDTVQYYAGYVWHRVSKALPLAMLGLLTTGLLAAIAVIWLLRHRLPLRKLSVRIGVLGASYALVMWAIALSLDRYGPPEGGEWLVVLGLGVLPALLALVAAWRQSSWLLLVAALSAAPLCFLLAVSPSMFTWIGLSLPCYSLSWVMMRLAGRGHR